MGRKEAQISGGLGEIERQKQGEGVCAEGDWVKAILTPPSGGQQDEARHGRRGPRRSLPAAAAGSGINPRMRRRKPSLDELGGRMRTGRRTIEKRRRLGCEEKRDVI